MEELKEAEELVNTDLLIVEDLICVLNQSVQQEDYREFLKNYAHLSEDEKTLYLSMALFENSERTFLGAMDHFLNDFEGQYKPVKSEKYPFVCFLKTLNDLCLNNSILVNLHTERKKAWDLYLPNKPIDINTETIRNILKMLMQKAVFHLNSLELFANRLMLDKHVEKIQGAPARYMDSLQKIIDKKFSKTLKIDGNEQLICMMFMLCQITEYDLSHMMKYIEDNLNFFNNHAIFRFAFFTFKLDEDFVISLRHSESEIQELLEVGVSIEVLSVLAQIDDEIYRTMIGSPSSIKSLMQDKWLCVKTLIQFAREKPSTCSSYLKSPRELQALKAAAIPFEMLIQEIPICLYEYDVKDIIKSLGCRKNYTELCAHHKVNMDLFYAQYTNFVAEQNGYFRYCCVKSIAFRTMIQNPQQFHALLDMGFTFNVLYNHLENDSYNIKNLMCYIEAVKLLLTHSEITPDILLTIKLYPETLKRVAEMLELLNHQIPLPLIQEWQSAGIDSAMELLDYRSTLISLKQANVDLNEFLHLKQNYPQHASLILKNPNHPISRWWFNRENNGIHFSSALKGQYHVVFDLDESTVSSMLSFGKKQLLSAFKEKGLYVESVVMLGAHGEPVLHIIHPGFIELLRFLHAHNIKISFFSRGIEARNKPLIEAILCKALGRKIYTELNATENLLKSREDMGANEHKDLKLLLKQEEDVQQIVIVDDDLKHRHPEQILQFMKIRSSSDISFDSILRNGADAKKLQGANHIFYVAGLLWEAINMAESKNITLSEALFSLQHNPNQPGEYCYAELAGYQMYYQIGLDILQLMNPTLELCTNGQLFSEDYTLIDMDAGIESAADNDTNKISTKRKYM